MRGLLRLAAGLMLLAAAMLLIGVGPSSMWLVVIATAVTVVALNSVWRSR